MLERRKPLTRHLQAVRCSDLGLCLQNPLADGRQAPGWGAGCARCWEKADEHFVTAFGGNFSQASGKKLSERWAAKGLRLRNTVAKSAQALTVCILYWGPKCWSLHTHASGGSLALGSDLLHGSHGRQGAHKLKASLGFRVHLHRDQTCCTDKRKAGRSQAEGRFRVQGSLALGSDLLY